MAEAPDSKQSRLSRRMIFFPVAIACFLVAIFVRLAFVQVVAAPSLASRASHARPSIVRAAPALSGQHHWSFRGAVRRVARYLGLKK